MQYERHYIDIGVPLKWDIQYFTVCCTRRPRSQRSSTTTRQWWSNVCFHMKVYKIQLTCSIFSVLCKQTLWWGECRLKSRFWSTACEVACPSPTAFPFACHSRWTHITCNENWWEQWARARQPLCNVSETKLWHTVESFH